MDLMEHQAKEIFLQYGIPVPKGMVLYHESALADALSTIGVDKFGVVKAQVLTGGRGEVGGIKVVDSLTQAREAVRAILGMRIKGLTVEKVLVEEKLDIKNEYFIGITIDPESLPALLISPKGGRDIEQIAKEFPTAIGKYLIRLKNGLPSFEVIELAKSLGLHHTLWGGLVDIAGKLYKAFCEKEATLIEVNPLVETEGGKLIAADGLLNVDDNALFRHSEFSQLRKELREMVLKDKGVDYIDLGDGEVGLLCAGAGMTMLTMDLVVQLGAKARCFIDMSHGVNPVGFTAALEVLASEPGVRYVLVNMFGGLTRMDEVAKSMLQAIESMGAKFPKPMVIRLQGTNVDEGQRIMREAGYEVYSELEEVMATLKKILEVAR